jgi:precorrin-4 methylase
VTDRSQTNCESGALNILSLTDLEAVFAALDDPRLPPAVPVALRHHAGLDEQAIVDQVHGPVVVVAQVVVPREPQLDLQAKARTSDSKNMTFRNLKRKASFHRVRGPVVVVAQVAASQKAELTLKEKV